MSKKNDTFLGAPIVVLYGACIWPYRVGSHLSVYRKDGKQKSTVAVDSRLVIAASSEFIFVCKNQPTRTC